MGDNSRRWSGDVKDESSGRRRRCTVDQGCYLYRTAGLAVARSRRRPYATFRIIFALHCQSDSNVSMSAGEACDAPPGPGRWCSRHEDNDPACRPGRHRSGHRSTLRQTVTLVRGDLRAGIGRNYYNNEISSLLTINIISGRLSPYDSITFIRPTPGRRPVLHRLSLLLVTRH